MRSFKSAMLASVSHYAIQYGRELFRGYVHGAWR